MYRIESKIDTNHPEFKENKQFYQEKIAAYRERLNTVKAGGPPEMPGMPPGAEMEGAPAAPPETAAPGDDNPVARMMRRRQQETGGGEGNQNE